MDYPMNDESMEKEKIAGMLDVIEELRDMARQMMDEEAAESGEDMDMEEMMEEGPQKVSVMAKDEKGLKEGLDKAKDLMNRME